MGTKPPDALAENRLLRDFYDAWVFMHKVRNEPSESAAWQKVRLEQSAQGLVDAAAKVQRHINAHLPEAVH